MRRDKPSLTARKVALNIVTLGSKRGMDEIMPPGIVESTADLLVASGVVGRKTIQIARSPRMVSVYKWFDWMLPGQFEAFGYRKAFCDRQVRDGIRNGTTQVLVLGAGYDTLGWRLSSDYLDVNFFEIDHPATSRIKARGINSIGKRGNLFLIPEDLGERGLVDVLNNVSEWDQQAQSVFIAEGLLMYLTPEAVHELFSQCAEISSFGSRIGFSYIPSGPDGKLDAGPWTKWMLRLQKVVGEPWIWSIQPGELGSFLEETGWRIPPELAKMGAQRGVEHFVIAEKSDIE